MQKFFSSPGLRVEHLGHADAGVADERAARLDDELAARRSRARRDARAVPPQHIGFGRRVAVVVDAQAAAEVQVVQRDAGRFDGLDQVEHALQRFEVGRGFGDLRADVAVDADHLQPGERAACR